LHGDRERLDRSKKREITGPATADRLQHGPVARAAVRLLDTREAGTPRQQRLGVGAVLETVGKRGEQPSLRRASEPPDHLDAASAPAQVILK